MGSNRWTWLAWICLCTCLGCGDDKVVGDPAGRTFLLESSEGFTPVEGETVRLSFGDGSLGVYAGCNHLGADDYEIDGDVLVAQGWFSTQIGCGAALHEQDQALEDFFTSRPSITLDGDRMTLAQAPVTLVFLDRELADPDRPFEGTTWAVDTFIANGGASNLGLPRPPAIVFQGGNADVDTTCNTGSGKYTISGDQVMLEAIAYTEVACDGASAAADASMQAVMQAGTLRFEIEAARLTLMRGNRGLGAQAEE